MNIHETAITKIAEITSVSCKRTFDFNNSWDQAPLANRLQTSDIDYNTKKTQSLGRSVGYTKAILDFVVDEDGAVRCMDNYMYCVVIIQRHDGNLCLGCPLLTTFSALRLKLPTELADHYVISRSELPLGSPWSDIL